MQVIPPALPSIMVRRYSRSANIDKIAEGIMSKLIKQTNASARVIVLAIAFYVFLAVIGPSPILADDVVFLDFKCGETMWMMVDNEIEIYIENDVPLNEFSLSLTFYSEDGGMWNWVDKDGFGASGAVTVVPGSRMWDAMSADSTIWDVTGLEVMEINMDGLLADSITIHGAASENVLASGPYEHMLSIHFNFPDQSANTFCVDSLTKFPEGGVVFVNAGSSSPYTPDYIGSFCNPIHVYSNCWPIFMEEPPVILSTSHCSNLQRYINIWPGAECEWAWGKVKSNSGYGSATFTSQPLDNGGWFNYNPASEDAGQAVDVVLELYDGECIVWDELAIQIEVLNDPLLFDGGGAYKHGATNNLITKDDIAVVNNDACDELEYIITSGPGEFDQSTGVYSWMPGPTDIGEFAVSYEVTDGIDAFADGFNIIVMDETCCPGDANFTSTTDVGDAVYLINHIFKGGPAPIVMNWGDPNADCSVNVGDVVYLINYIFHSGAAPQLGCYY